MTEDVFKMRNNKNKLKMSIFKIRILIALFTKLPQNFMQLKIRKHPNEILKMPKNLADVVGTNSISLIYISLKTVVQ